MRNLNGRLRAAMVVFMWFTAVASAAPALVGISPDRLLAQAASEVADVPLGNILGAVIGEAGDLILIGERCDFCAQSPGRLLQEAAIAAQLRGAPSVTTTSSIARGSTDTRLDYSAAVAGTALGQRLADSIELVNAIADGDGELPIAFEAYPAVERQRFIVSADMRGCLQAENYKVVLLTGHPIRLYFRGSDEREEPPSLRSWRLQTEERYAELASLYPELNDLKRFLKLAALYWVTEKRDNTDKAGAAPSRGLLGYRSPARSYPPDRISYDFRRNIVAEIAGGENEDVRDCKQREGLKDLRAKVIAASRAPTAENGYFYFDADLWDLSPEYRFTRLVSRSTEVGTYANTVWLDARLSSSQPRLKVFYENRSFSLPEESAIEFAMLVRRTEQVGKDTDKLWSDFRERHLKTLLGSGGGSRDRLVIVLDGAAIRLANISRISSLNRDLQVIVASRKGNGFAETAMELLDRIAALNRILAENIAYVVQTDQDDDAERFRSLATLIGVERVLIDAGRSDLERLLRRRDINIVMFDVGMGHDSLQLGGVRVGIRDLLYMGRLDHIQAVVFGVFGLHKNVPDSGVIRAMQTRGVGVVALADDVGDSVPAATKIAALMEVSTGNAPVTSAALDVIERILGYKPVMFERVD